MGDYLVTAGTVSNLKPVPDYTKLKKKKKKDLTNVGTQVPNRSPKLSSDESISFWDGWPLSLLTVFAVPKQSYVTINIQFLR